MTALSPLCGLGNRALVVPGSKELIEQHQIERWDMVTLLEATKEQSHARLLDLDALRQRPQTQLADVVARRSKLQAQLAALGPVRVENKIERGQLVREIARLDRDVEALENKLQKIDGEAAAHHAQVRECERPGDEAKLRDKFNAACLAMDAARIAVAEFFLAGAALERAYGGAGRLANKQLVEGFHERERTLRDRGWQRLDPVSTPVGQILFAPMTPPAGKS